MQMKWLDNPGCWVFDDGRIAVPKSNGQLYFSKQTLNSNGYLRVHIGYKRHLVHRLVGIAFVKQPDNCKFVDHIDRNRLNNCATNLRWVTATENMLNTCRHDKCLQKYGVCKYEDPAEYNRRSLALWRKNNPEKYKAQRERYAAKKAAPLQIPVSSQEP